MNKVLALLKSPAVHSQHGSPSYEELDSLTFFQNLSTRTVYLGSD